MKVQGSQQRVVTTAQAPVSSAEASATATTEPVKAGWVAKGGKAAPVTAPGANATETRNKATAEQFFAAFGKRDLSTVEQHYRPDAKFKDDMFTLTKRSSIMKMWNGSPPFKTFKAEVLEAKGDTVKAKWTCDYVMFGKQVHNEIESTLTFDAQGKIVSQNEHWDRTKWMSQALPMIPKFLQGAAYAVMGPLLSMNLGG
ncbi:MAG: nuclear transport factor 2 family protein [Archangiaceae bacterium]|nr:nuclear transport factor 2 family protein [Archangiaceae bacterium]